MALTTRVAVADREVAVREVLGEDEAWLAEEGRTLLPVERATALLARCLLADDAPALARELPVGAREALLLHVRRLTLGPRLDAVHDCSACGAALDVPLDLAALLDAAPPAAPAPAAARERSFAADGRALRLRYRLPTGADHEAAARAALADPRAGEALLVARAALAVHAEDGAPLPRAEWPPQVAEALADAVAEDDPLVEVRLDVACPACGAAGEALLDPTDFILAELAPDRERLDREVHALALHYHWSERDILALPRRRRRRYLDLLAEAGGAA